MRLELGQVEVAPVPAVVAQVVQPEVEQPARDRASVDFEVTLDQVPAARPHEQHGHLVGQPVLLLRGDELDRPLERVRQVALALDAVLPGGRIRVLEIGHEHLRAGVERVDHHLPLDRPGDLDAPVGDLVGKRGNPPVAGADLRRPGQEVRQLAGTEPCRPLVALREQLVAARAKLALEIGEELDRFRREDVARLHQPDSSCLKPRRIRTRPGRRAGPAPRARGRPRS